MAELVRVATVDDELAAELAVGYLRTEGIPAIHQRSTSQSRQRPFDFVTTTGSTLGRFDILVHPDNQEHAVELLSEDGDTDAR